MHTISKKDNVADPDCRPPSPLTTTHENASFSGFSNLLIKERKNNISSIAISSMPYILNAEIYTDGFRGSISFLSMMILLDSSQ